MDKDDFENFKEMALYAFVSRKEEFLPQHEYKQKILGFRVPLSTFNKVKGAKLNVSWICKKALEIAYEMEMARLEGMTLDDIKKWSETNDRD